MLVLISMVLTFLWLVAIYLPVGSSLVHLFLAAAFLLLVVNRLNNNRFRIDLGQKLGQPA